MKENERFYGFTDFRGPAAQRGREGRGSANQVTAGALRVKLTLSSHFLGGGNFLSHTTTGSTQQTNDRKRFRDVYQASPSHTRQSLAKKETPRGRGGSLSPPRSALSVGSLAR